MSAYFYTITKNGKQYRATCPYYHWRKVTEYFGLSRSEIKRGAAAHLPWIS